jgi:hypothetical protein
MKHSILILLLVTSSLSGEERALGFYSVISEDGRPTADAIFTIEAKADRTIWHDQDKNFDLGLGKVSDGARTPIDLKFPEIKSFLERERHKDLVVVWFDKTQTS